MAKHHQTYVNNLNNLVPGTRFENASLEQIIREADGAIFNNGAQIWNHTFYFESFSPSGQREPGGLLPMPFKAHLDPLRRSKNSLPNRL